MKKYIVKENGEIVGVFLNAGQACALNDEYMKYGRSCTIDIVTEPDETEPTETETTTNEEEKTMTEYRYEDAMKSDILDYIAYNINRNAYEDDRDRLEERLNDDLFCEDSVTGNASGSYYCNAYRAKESVIADGIDYIREACADFGIEAKEIGEKFIRQDWEWMDVTIRCYLLGGMISAVLDELEEAGYFDESEIDESDIIATVRAEIA